MRKFASTIVLLLLLDVQAICQSTIIDSLDSLGTKAKQHTLTGSFEMNYLRHYLWRGLVFGNNDVAQPMFEINYKDFTLGLAQNFNYQPKNVPKEFYTKNAFFDEQDVEISYSKKLGKFSTQFKAMAYFYFYQPQSPNTAEFYNWTGFDLYKGFSFFTENSIDFVSYKGAVYSNNGFLYELNLQDNLQIEWTAYAGFANSRFNLSYVGLKEGSLNLIGSHLEVTKNFDKFYVKLIVEKNQFMNNAIKEISGVNGTDNFGVAAGIGF